MRALPNYPASVADRWCFPDPKEKGFAETNSEQGGIKKRNKLKIVSFF